MFASIPISTLMVTWAFSAFVLTLGIFLVGRIMGWRGELGFWGYFPLAVLVTAILTIIDWGIGFIHMPIIPGLARICLWFAVIMKAFDMEFMDAILLAIVLFLAKMLFLGFIISAVLSLIH